LLNFKENAPKLSFEDVSGIEEITVKVIDPTAPGKKVVRHTAPFHSLNLRNWDPQPEAMVSDLQKFQDVIEAAIKDKDYLFVVNSVQDIMEHLPIDWVTNEDHSLDVWKLLPEVQKKEIIHTLSELSKLSYQGILLSCTTHPSTRCMFVDSKTFVAHLKALTFAHRLLSLSEDKKFLDQFKIHILKEFS